MLVTVVSSVVAIISLLWLLLVRPRLGFLNLGRIFAIDFCLFVVTFCSCNAANTADADLPALAKCLLSVGSLLLLLVSSLVVALPSGTVSFESAELLRVSDKVGEVAVRFACVRRAEGLSEKEERLERSEVGLDAIVLERVCLKAINE